jgi:hypothetical protein
MHEDQYMAGLEEIWEYTRDRQDRETTKAFYEWVEFLAQIAHYFRFVSPEDKSFEFSVALEDQSVMTAAKLINANSKDGIYLIEGFCNVALYALNYGRLEYIAFLMLEDFRNLIPLPVSDPVLTL